MLTYIQSFFKNRFAAIARYPGATLVSFLIAITALVLNHQPGGEIADTEVRNMLARIVAAGLFMFPLMIVGPLTSIIRGNTAKKYDIIGQVAASIFGLLFYLCLPANFNTLFGSDQVWVVLSMLSAWIGSLGCVVYACRYDSSAIRARSQHILSRAVIAVVASVIVGGGVAASLSSIEYLFNLYIDSKVYMDVRICSFSLIGMVIWLISLNNELQEIGAIKLFRFFGLYIFVPLTILYALILLTYSVQIAVTGDWPQGKVTRMVIGYTLFGLVGYLLTYPIRADHPGMRKVYSGYFISLLIFSILLFAAIYIRIDQYGLTTMRYLVVASGIWIVVMALWSLLRPAQSLSVIVLGFVVGLLISTFGPQSAVSLPVTTQYNMLVDLLTTNNFIQAGKIVPRAVNIPENQPLTGDLSDIYHIASYLGQERGAEIFEPLYSGTGFDQLSGVSQWNVGEQFMITLGLNNVYDNDINFGYSDSEYSFYANGYSEPLNISDYSLFIPIKSQTDKKEVDGTTVGYERSDSSKITVTQGTKQFTIDLLDSVGEIKKASLSYRNGGSAMSALQITTSDYMLLLNQISVREVSETNIVVSYYDGLLFLK